MTVWVVVAVSCTECNRVATVVYDHEPTDVERAEAAKIGWGMYCYHTNTIKCEVNGDGGACWVDNT